MSHPDACLFDLDGLLLDTEPLHGQAWRQAAARFGAGLSDEQLLELRGRRRPDCVEQVRRWIADGGESPPSGEELLAVRQPIARALLADAPAMPGAPELLARCGALGIPTALVTSSASEAVALKSRGHPWLQNLTLRILGDDPDLKAGKPAPDPFLLAARRLGVAAENCWALEDSPAGVRSAVAAGCRVFVLSPPGLTTGDHGRLYGDRCEVVESLERVLKMLEALTVCQ